MKASALAISLILILVPLAGCSGTDTEVNVDLSNEDINDLIDENLEDVMNNTTVVVFQEYHNNTTVVNQYSNNSTSNVDQSGASSSTTTYNYNGSNSDPELFVVILDFDWSDIVEGITVKRENNFTVEFSYYDYATNDDRTDTFTLPCSNYYNAPEQGNNSSTSPTYWEDNDNYWDWWDFLYNNTIRDLLSEYGYSSTVEDACRESDGYLIDNSVYNGDYSTAPVFYEMAIPNGSAIRVVQINAHHRYTPQWSDHQYSNSHFWTVNGISPNGCDGLTVIVNFWNDECGDLWGGWADIELDFQVRDDVYPDSTFEFIMYYELVPVTNV